MRLLVTHGYMLSGTGSNVYVQNLCRALVKNGHDVHLLCQEARPLAHDFVAEHATADGKGVETLGARETPYPGRCVVYNPRVGDLLPVYVYDDYPGWRVKTFLDLTDGELENYVARNVEAVRAVLGASGAEAVVTNHSLPGPLIARRALRGPGVPYASVVHGSCLQYAARKNGRYMEIAREGLGGARAVVALSSHSAATVEEDFPGLSEKTRTLPGGVDTDLFRPDALDVGALRGLNGGPGRGPEQRTALRGALEGAKDAKELGDAVRRISQSYNARSHDADAGRRLGGFLAGGGPLVLYVGKLIHSKGVHALISAFARVRRRTGARLLIVGFGTFREGLEALTLSLGAGDERGVERLAEMGRLLEGGPAGASGTLGPLEHFEPSEALLREAMGVDEGVEFVGPLGHGDLARLLPVADVAAVPSIFPETFGLVAAELAASGVVPFVADHSGLREAGAIVGRGLPFDLQVPMDGFEENLARALGEFLARPERERARHRQTVRSNSVDFLGWGTLAEEIAAIAGGDTSGRQDRQTGL